MHILAERAEYIRWIRSSKRFHYYLNAENARPSPPSLPTWLMLSNVLLMVSICSITTALSKHMDAWDHELELITTRLGAKLKIAFCGRAEIGGMRNEGLLEWTWCT